MGSTLWPVNGTFQGRSLRQTIGGVWGAVRSRPLGVRTGVVAGTPTDITVSTSSGSWSVAPHKGVLDVETNAIAGPYFYSFDTTQSGTLNAAHATLDRIDLLSITMSDTSEGDGSTAGPTITYTPGTAASSPSAPATPAKSMALAQITVPHSGGGSPVVQWVARLVVAAGGIVPAADSSQFPGSPYVGQYVDDPAVGLRRWNGTSWSHPVPGANWLGLSLDGPFNDDSGAAQYRNDGLRVYLRGTIAKDSGTAFATGTAIEIAAAGAIAAGSRPNRAMAFLCTSPGGSVAVRVTIGSDGSVTILTNDSAVNLIDLAGAGPWFAE